MTPEDPPSSKSKPPASERGQLETAVKQLRLYDEQQQLLITLAERLMLLTPDDLYEGLSAALEPLTLAAGADRIMLVMLDFEIDELSCRAEWHQPGVTPAMPRMQNIPLASIADLVRPLQAGTVLPFEDVTRLPEAHFLPKMAKVLGLPAILMVPLTSREGVLGTMTTAAREPRKWSEQLTGVMQIAGQLIGNTILRCDRERRLREREDELKKTLEHQLKLEQQLLQAQKMESVGLLAGGVAHDFNNVLCAIRCVCDMMLYNRQLGDEVKSEVNEIVNATEQAASLTRQLMAFSRKQLLSVEPLDVHHLFGEMRELIARLLGEELELRVNLVATHPVIKADPTQLQQIIMNLVANGRDAMSTGGHMMVETSNLELDAEQVELYPDVKPGPYLLLSISDTGHGMDAETAGRIFDPFFTTKTKGRGTGLGLATVYGIVKQHGGHILVRSEPGAGATFDIFLPNTSETPASHRDEACIVPAKGKGELILLAEDQHLPRDATARMLTAGGYRVITAQNGAEGLELAKKQGAKLDLLVSDVVMPRMSGPELFTALRELQPDLRAVFISGYPGETIAQHGLPLDILFLQKPFAMQALLGKVREALEPDGAVASA